MLKQTKMINKEPLTFKSRCPNAEKLKDVNHQLMQKDWIGLLTGTTCNDKFDNFSGIVNNTLDEVGPIKTIQISGKQRYIEPWMTRGLEESSKTKLKLYKKTLVHGSTPGDIKKYEEHRNLYNALK